MIWIFIFFTFLNAFEVEFIKIYSKYITPNQDAISVKTKKNLIFPYQFVKTNDGYILFGNVNDIEIWINNSFYPPKDAIIKNIKIATINYDKIFYYITHKTKKEFKNCKIKKIKFLTPNKFQTITKPTTITVKYKIILDCNVSNETKEAK